MTLAADVLFDFDKSEIKPEGKAGLDALASKIKGVNLDVAIAVGHTDGVGSDAYNQRLSLARAESVKAYLVSQGIPAARIRTASGGEYFTRVQAEARALEVLALVVAAPPALRSASVSVGTSATSAAPTPPTPKMAMESP